MKTFCNERIWSSRLLFRFEYMLMILPLVIFLNSCKKIDAIPEDNASSQSGNAAVASKPNIILLLGDDVGYEIPTCNGGQSYKTPNIDKMAAQGMRFTACHATPLCSPSRVSLLTGKYNFRNYTGWGVLDTTNRTFANMLKDAGYKTLAAGKWQLNGGDASLRTFGFSDYLIWSPFTSEDGKNVDGKGSRYKNPILYQNARFIDRSLTLGKYGDDLLTDYVKNFIDNNKANPFFIYYSLCLCHMPFEPTPDDPEFATWNTKTDEPDTAFFPSMVKYMDKKIGEILDKVASDPALKNNTYVIYVGDNGTDARIRSLFDNKIVKGGKSKSLETGQLVPLIVWRPGTIAPGSVNNNLIDLTDFMPTFADMAQIPLPTTYGPLDGTSFRPFLIGEAGKPRQWIFCHFDPQMHEGTPLKRWVENATYKLYDGTNTFYNIQTDPRERRPIPDSELTVLEQQTKTKFQGVLNKMH